MSQLDAYGDWLKIPRDRRGPDGRPLTHYDLLRLTPEEASPERIARAAVEQSTAARTYASSPQEDARQWVDRLRREIAEALICLSDPHKRQQYDRKHLGRAGAAPKDGDEPAAPDVNASADSGPAVAEWSEADELVLQWLMQGSDPRAPRKAKAARESTAPGSEEGTTLAAVRAAHRRKWLKEVSKRRERSRLKRRLMAVVAAACALLAVVMILRGREAARKPWQKGPPSPTAQVGSQAGQDPPAPNEPPLPELASEKPPESSPEAKVAAPSRAAPGTGTSGDPRRRAVVLTLPETVNEGDAVALKAQLGAGVTPAPHAVTIDWGDGTPPDEAKVTPSSAAPGTYTIDARHVYADNGEFEVRVSPRPDYRATTIASQKVKVGNVAPKMTVKKCEVRGDASVRVEVVFADPGANDTHDVLVQWGDGAQEFVEPKPPLVGGEWTVAARHTYAGVGDYTIAITVVDKDDASEQARRTVSVLRPSISPSAPPRASPARAVPASEKWFAVIVYKRQKVLETAVVQGKARADARATRLHRAARDEDAEVEIIETDTREKAQRAIQDFRPRRDSRFEP